MNPETGTAQVTLYDVASGGLMATTTQAVTQSGGKRGFWGGRIRNPARLDRVTLRIAKATRPAVDAMLRGVVERQN